MLTSSYSNVRRQALGQQGKQLTSGARDDIRNTIREPSPAPAILPPFPGLQLPGPATLALDRAVQLLCSPRARDADAGARTLRLFLLRLRVQRGCLLRLLPSPREAAEQLRLRGPGGTPDPPAAAAPGVDSTGGVLRWRVEFFADVDNEDSGTAQGAAAHRAGVTSPACYIDAGSDTWVPATAAQALLSDALNVAMHVASTTHVPYESYQQPTGGQDATQHTAEGVDATWSVTGEIHASQDDATAPSRAGQRLAALHGLLLLVRYLLADVDWGAAAPGAPGWAWLWLEAHTKLIAHVQRTCLPPLADPHGTGNDAADVDLVEDDASDDDDDDGTSEAAEQLRSSGK